MYTLSFIYKQTWSRLVKHFLLVVFLAGVCVAQQSSTETQELTIRSIYASNGIPDLMPEAIKWSPDGNKVSYFLQDEKSGKTQLYYIDVSTGKSAVLVASEKLSSMTPPPAKTKDDREKDNRARYHVAPYHWSPDSQHILFDVNGQLWLHTLSTGTSLALSSSGDPIGDPKFSPDGKRLAFIRRHNLRVQPIAGGEEVAVTRDKDENLLSGEVDWVYAEELSVRSNYFWSPNGKKIVFLQMDETKVPTYPITDFIPQHPTVSEEKYPKVGDPNPEVRLAVVNSDGGKPHWINLTDNKDIYIPRFGWVRDDLIWATVLNRAQNQLDLYFFDAASGKSRKVLSEKSDTWIETDDNFRILSSGDKFIWPSWRDGYTHLYLYSFDMGSPLSSEAKLEHQITKGEFEVFSIEGIDESSGTLYATTNALDDRQRHLCSVKLDGSGFRVLTQDEPGTHASDFSPNAKAYIDDFSALMTPPRMSFCRVGGNCDVLWKSPGLEQRYHLAAPQFVDFQAEDGTRLHGVLFLPPQSDGKKIPLLMNPYGGPAVQTIRDQWESNGLLFNNILMRDGIAVLSVDNRGMAGRGKKFASVVMHNFGETELKDQLAALDQVLSRFPQLDGTRLGWWGWSYGGYMTLNALTHTDRFKAGVAVAPVTDWHDYDSIYTERYAGLVPEFEAAYKKSSPITYAKQLHGHLLEVHGTSDDNVHMQNTMQMINAFIDAGKQFDILLYPRKTHAISGAAARIHLFTRIRDHFRRELLGQPPVETEKAE
jgi:dipeptidyl-peptidase-4